MFKPNLHHARLIIALMVLATTNAIAAEKDFDLPIKVDSKAQFVDGKTKTSIFREDVRITQGSLKIDADEVEVIASQGEGSEVFIARGNPASYSQTMDDGSSISAAANEIRYELALSTLTLSGNAELKQNSSQVTGDSIVFNRELEQLIAQGSETGVTTIFQPNSLRKLQTDSDKSKENPTEQDDQP
jgi:lipopolysaccharide export system protein LptA